MVDTGTIIRHEAARLAEVARSEPTAPIPRYAGWAMTDLVGHTGSVHRRTIDIVRNRLKENPGRHPAPALDPPELIEWFETGAKDMADLLESVDPATEVWGFGPDQTVGFWRTRMALETSVHRIDAEEAVGEADDLDADLAIDGIDEFGIIWLAGLPVPDDARGPFVALQCTDRDVRWVVEAGTHFTLSRKTETARATFSDTASDLYLFLIGRIPHHRLTAEGDPAAVEAWVTALSGQRPATL